LLLAHRLLQEQVRIPQVQEPKPSSSSWPMEARRKHPLLGRTSPLPRPHAQEETLNTMMEVAAAEAPVNLSEKIFTLSNTVASRATFGKRSDHQDRFI
ncbi:unnamed protein product, partial [Musa textilis]